MRFAPALELGVWGTDEELAPDVDGQEASGVAC